MQPLTAKILDRGILLAATLLLAGKQYGVPRSWATALDSRPFVVFILIGVISIFGAFTPFQAVAARSRVERRAAIRQHILTHYGAILTIATQANPPVTIGDVGLHVWRRRRTWRHPVSGTLRRVATYRLGTTPATRPFSPPVGVGVIGLCWRDNREVGVDVEKLANQLHDEATFNAYKHANGADSVMGLTWREFSDVRHRGAVFASPIRDGAHKFIGCVSVDASKGYDALDNPRLWHAMNSLCAILGHDGLRNV